MKRLLVTLAALSFLNAEEAKVVEVTITGSDAMQYDQKEVTVKAGESVKLTFKHVGALPKTAMGHNIAILKPESDMAGFASACIAASATDYIPAEGEMKKLVVAHTKMLGGGEEDVIEVTFEEAGVYPFLCTFPGHFAIMNGKITVE